MKIRDAEMKVNAALNDRGGDTAVFILFRRRCVKCRRSDIHRDLRADLAMSGMAAGSATSSSHESGNQALICIRNAPWPSTD